MADQRTAVQTIVLVALVVGAVVFVLLLAGVGSGMLTNPPS
jgi:hypothetical protein